VTIPTHPVIVVVGGGQSGLAAARAARDAGLNPVVLEAGDRPAGSWPRYYDSLRLFSPARYSAMPGFPMNGNPDRYPTRDEIADYLDRYAQHLGVDIRTRTSVTAVEADGPGFVVHTADGDAIPAAGLVAASGSFGNPAVPHLPGQDSFTGELLHVAGYRNPAPYADKRVMIVGGGNSGVQVADELAGVADLTLATLAPISFLPQVIRGHDLHYWLRVTRFDHLPTAWLRHIVRKPLVLDTGRYRDGIESGRIDRRAMFTAFDGDSIVWPDGKRERVDAVILATGYRPNLGYLAPLGALDDNDLPLHAGGISTTHSGLVYLGLEFQRSFSSNTVRGVSRDADHVIRALAAHVQQAHAIIGR
jgi:putative flavoprotein involved in K+ transport